MKNFNINNFENFLIKKKLVGIREEGFLLKSGKRSYWYANFRDIVKNFSSLKEFSRLVFDFLIDNFDFKNIDGILGIPEGTTILGFALQEKLVEKKIVKDNIILARVNFKNHGIKKNRIFINGFVPKKVILIEDVTTTGGSCIEFIKKIQKENIQVAALVSLFNRLQLDKDKKSVIQKFNELGIKYLSICDAKILKKMNLTNSQKEKIKEEFRENYSGAVSLLPPDIF